MLSFAASVLRHLLEMSLSTSNIYAALDTKKDKKKSKSSKDSGDKKKKESSEPDRYHRQINLASSITSCFPRNSTDAVMSKITHAI